MSKIRGFLNIYALSIVAGILIGTSYIPFPPWASVFCFVPLWLTWFKFAGVSFTSGAEKSGNAAREKILATTSAGANSKNSADDKKVTAKSAHSASKNLSESTAKFFTENFTTKQIAKKIFFAGWVTQFVFTMIGFNWIALTVHEFGMLPWPVAIVVQILFGAVANLDVPLTGLAWYHAHRKFNLRPLPSLFVLGLFTALFEAWVPTLFPWNYGYTWLWSNVPIAQIAELIGFQGLSSLILLLNCGAFLVWQRWREYRAHPTLQTRHAVRKALLPPLGFFLALNVGGTILRASLPTPDRELKAMIVQANIGNLQKQQAEKGWGFREFITERYTSLGAQGLLRFKEEVALRGGSTDDARVDFVLWPETAYPYDIDQRLWSENSPPIYPTGAQSLLEFVTQTNTNLITGGYGYAPRDGKITNTMFMVEKPDGDKPAAIHPYPYYKTILVPFGEFIPGADYYPKVKDWIAAGDFSRGEGPAAKDFAGFRIGPQICYESLFPSFTKALADQNAQVLVNVTNDSWYGTWQEPYQHLYMTLARAVEFRRPLIRATNTGISTAVLASGQVLEKSPMIQEWTGVYTIAYLNHPPITFYQRCPWLIDALLIAMMLLILVRSRFERPKQS